MGRAAELLGFVVVFGQFERILLGEGRWGEAGEMEAPLVKSHRAERAATPRDSCRGPGPGGLALLAVEGEASLAPSRLRSRGKPDPAGHLLPQPVPVLSAAGRGGTGRGPGAARAAARRSGPRQRPGRGVVGAGPGGPAGALRHSCLSSSLGPWMCFSAALSDCFPRMSCGGPNH